MNSNQMEQVENFVQEIGDKVKSDLQSSILANGKIEAGRRTVYKFDEDVISELRWFLSCACFHEIKVNRPWKESLELLFQVDLKHRAAERKARRTSQRTSEVMKKIAPGLDEDSRCESSHIVKELVFKLNKREKKWLEMVEMDDLACVASVSVGFGSKERPRNGVFGILTARKMGREPKKERWG